MVRKDLPVVVEASEETKIVIYCPYCGHRQEEPIMLQQGTPVECAECHRITMAIGWSMGPWKKEE